MGYNVRKRGEMFLGPVQFKGAVSFGEGAGLDFSEVQAVLGAEALAAAGSGQSTYAQITKQLNAVTGADGTKGVALPAASAGKAIFIVNTDASNELNVAPIYEGNDQINALTSGTGVFVLQPGAAAWFIPTSATKWYVEGDAGVSTDPDTVSISLAAGATNTLVATLTVRDAAGDAIAAVHQLEVWISENANGIGLTGDTISGDATWGANQELEEITSKKRFTVLTTTGGIATLSIVDSAKPADQYIAVRHPRTGRVIVSAASGANWG
ncbi:MAG: hypothetical protein KJZ75_11245 [Hyphomonadaceae bacterium]|nr:hypothetical protein [Hyphomonadaceae bacterium]